MGAGASKKIVLDGKTTDQARAEAAAQVKQLVSGYDSDVDNELGYKYAGRREMTSVADGSGQGLAEKPWLGAIHPPSIWKEDDNSEPLSDALLLEWAYGYRGYDSRDNLMYTASGEIVYVTAGVGVVYDPSSNKQRFYFDHTDDVLCLAVHPSGSLVATGQIGVDPKICLWDTNSMSTISIIHKCHSRGIASIAISADGKRIASIGMDQENTIVVHELSGENVPVIASQKGGSNKLYLLKFNPKNSNQFIAVGTNTVRFCSFENNVLQIKNGLFGNKGTQTVLSLCYITVGNEAIAITGTEKGEIFKWNGNNAIQASVAVHQGPVFSLFADGDTIVTGGKDGKVMLLNSKLETLKVFDVREVANNIVDSLGRSLVYVIGKAPPVKSVCRERGKILLGTANCEVIEIDEASGAGKLIVQGHSSGELWGLACHPSKDEFATACDDKTVRVWSAQQKKMLGMRKVNGEARSVAYNSSGTLIAVGCLNGSLLVCDSETLKEVFSTTIRKEEISEVKFSPDDKFLAMGSHDNFIDVFDVSRGFKLIGTCKGHSSFIIHFDWSRDSRYIQSNCGAYELLFWDARGQVQITKSSDLKDVDWHSWTCILGWPVQGIWQKEAKGTDVNATDRSHIGDLLVTADDFGMVNLFKYPVPKSGTQYKRYPGHSAHVTCARFTYNDKRIITTGGNDKTIFQWRRVDESQKILPNDDEMDDPIAAKELENTNYEKNRTMKEKVKLVSVKNEPFESAGFEKAARPPIKSDSKSEAASSSSEKPVANLSRAWFAGSQPWLGSIYPPSGAAPSDNALPKESLSLEYVYGYRGHDARDNLFSLQSGEIIYSAAGVAVIHNTTNNTQRIFSEHSDDIVSLTVAPDGQTVATGQVGRDPTILVWDSATLKVLAVLRASAQRAITSLGFSPDGVRLASVGLDDQHTLTVWDWKNQAIQAQAPGYTDKIFSVDFNPFDESSIVTCGVKHIKFWTLNGKTLESKKGIFGQVAEIQNIHSSAFLSPFLTIAGSQSGQILKFEKNVLKEAFPLHQKTITALHSNKTGIISADIDGKIKLWTHEFKPYKDISFDLAPFIKSNQAYASDIRSVRWIGGKVIAATESSEVYEIDIASKTIKIINHGHSGGETWGLAAHPSQPRFATASEDGSIRVWSIEEHKLLSMKRLDSAATAVAYSPNGGLIVVGTNDGQVIFLDSNDLSERDKKKDRVERISDIKLSPDGKLVAVGSHDNFIDIYTVDSFQRQAVCKGHSSFITHLDWTEDSKWIQSNCGAYELLFWNAATGEQEKRPHKLRDSPWSTNSCVLGWGVQGIWPRGADGTDVNAVSTSHKKNLLVSGDDFGTVKLFNYPAAAPKSQYKAYHGHSAHVTNVVFSSNDKYIISTGGADRSILQWKVQQ